ncbi:MAG: hypothetical protein A2X36_00795 [Elusimicrobia bacterium GWA2_69_24]|nr:MAG: hypothetical protein A2X36_00795 [Elusimicrobia bacterium GWA2_69_24]HBL17843.1 CoA-binding protein [Elusimicrobiota bacterium]
MAESQDYEPMLEMQVVAVVGCSPDPAKPSCRVASYLMEAGYRVIPVNPKFEEILGERCYPDLRAIPEPVEVVDIFRKADQVLGVVQEAIAIKAKGVWIQDGIQAPEAARLAREHGLKVVVDDCIMRQHLSRFGR